MWYEQVKAFFEKGSLANYILDGYLLFVIVLFLVIIIMKSRHLMAIIIPIILAVLFCFLAFALDLEISKKIYQYVCYAIPIFIAILVAPDVHNWLDVRGNKDKSTKYQKASDDNKQAIVDAVMVLSSRKTGALITIERFKLLDQYSERAIILNAEISKELLINIFEKNTPLHDGAVIIKGDKIHCAGAYYVLSTREVSDKTVGSRHRAALGICEVTDSFTIVVSEETGKVSIAYDSIIMPISDRETLLDYVSRAMED